MFIRFIEHSENQEILLNTNSIWKIEVKYGRDKGDGDFVKVPLQDAAMDPGISRFYPIFIGNERHLVKSDPNDKVSQVLAKIYNDAVRGPTE